MIECKFLIASILSLFTFDVIGQSNVFPTSGDVGVGLTNPRAKLHLTSTTVENSSTSQYDANLIIEASSSTRDMTEGAALGFVVPANQDGSNPWQQGRILVTPDNMNDRNASGRMYLQTRYATSGGWQWRNNLVLKSNGNVGIGTSTPDSKLAVNGTIHTKEVRVDLSNWSDFVFESGYSLPTLEEVANHIKKYGHLKDIPSAKEVEENGILLGEMDAKLLKKIEELTLYIIQLEKRLELQENELKNLNK